MKPENVDMIKRFLMLVILSAMFTVVIVLFNGCTIDYSGQYQKLTKMGMSKPCANYILSKLDKKSSEAEKLVFAQTCNKDTIFNLCGGMDNLNNNELKFLKCLTNLK